MQILETWDPQACEPALLAVEQALMKASEDALSETRALARQLVGAYSASWQHRMHDLLQQMNGNLRAKMIQAITAYRPGKLWPAP